MKAIIPVAGAGRTLRPHTHTQPKALIPVAGKPILGHIIETLRAAGVDEFVFVIGYLGEKIRDYVNETYHGKLRYQFVLQEPRRGLAQALWLCKDAIQPNNESIVIALGDTIVDTDTTALLRMPGSVVCVQEVDSPGQFGVVAVDEAGYIKSLVEKPNIPKSNLALVGLYKIEPSVQLFAALDHVIQNNVLTGGEYQLTDALMHMVSAGARIQTQRVKNWYDCGNKEVLLETNRILLARQPHVDYSQRFPRAVIVPPVSLPEHCVIENAVVGPYVALGEHAHIENAIVQDTIAGAYSRLDNIILRNAIVGNDTTLKGRWQSINIGDNTELDFNI